MDNLSELKAMPIWVCWNKVEKSGRMAKVPCSAAGGKTGTNEEYRDTWVRYDEAVNAAQKYMYSGVGFVIPEGCFSSISTTRSLTTRSCRIFYPASAPTPNTLRADRDCISTANAIFPVCLRKR